MPPKAKSKTETPRKVKAAFEATAKRIESEGQPEMAGLIREIGESLVVDAGSLVQVAKILTWAREANQETGGAPVVGRKVLAEWSGVAVGTVSRWVQLGCPKPDRGKYDLSGVLRWLDTMRRNYFTVKARLDDLQSTHDEFKANRAKLLAMDVAERQGKLVSRQSVELDRVRKFNIIRRELERLPATIGPVVVEQSADQATRTIEDEIARVLYKLTTTDDDSDSPDN